MPAHARAPQHEQHDGRQREPQERRAARAQVVEQRHGEGRADLERRRRPEHHADRQRAAADGLLPRRDGPGRHYRSDIALTYTSASDVAA
jgi:hypothetical protein